MSAARDVPGPATLTRKEFHELVCQIPTIHLAERFGISGNGLVKICVRLGFSVLPRGYWAKKAVGKKVPIVALPHRQP